MTGISFPIGLLFLKQTQAKDGFKGCSNSNSAGWRFLKVSIKTKQILGDGLFHNFRENLLRKTFEVCVFRHHRVAGCSPGELILDFC